jgi:predicted NAD-dependent protein-ADP-ribosyltransferase YbiA (DUF1768 family)
MNEDAARDREAMIGVLQTDAMNPAAWPGLNLLGFALMEVRGQVN